MKATLSILLIFALAAIMAVAAPNTPEKDKYMSLEVAEFTIKPGVGFPQDYMTRMAADLVNEINEGRKFKQVFSGNNKPKEITGPTLRLEGEVIEYKAGNQAARYLVGFGAGKTKIVAHVKFIDVETGNVLFEDDVDGKVVMGLLGGNSQGATRGLAKEVRKVATKTFFKP